MSGPGRWWNEQGTNQLRGGGFGVGGLLDEGRDFLPVVHLYRDESGTLRSVLRGEEEVFVLGVVAGEQFDCAGCAKRAVRDVSDLSEAKWNDLTELQKRRAVDCFREKTDLSFGYVAIERETLLDLNGHHLLFQNDVFDTDWDLLTIGHAYRELLDALPVSVTSQGRFRFDKLASQSISNEVLDLVEARWPDLDVDHGSSRQTRGIQAADCFAGAVAEDIRKNTAWCDTLDSQRIVDASEETLIRLQQLLHDESAGP